MVQDLLFPSFSAEVWRLLSGWLLHS